MNQKPTLVLFDFDGTLTKKDSFIDFIKFSVGHIRFCIGVACLIPLIVLFKLQLFSARRLKESFLTLFFRNRKEEALNELGRQYAQERLKDILFDDAFALIQKYDAQDTQVVIVSASFDIWLRPCADILGIDLVISSKLMFSNGSFTGKLEGANCTKEVKVNKLNDHFDLNKYYVIGFGNSRDDFPMLERCSEAYLRKKNGTLQSYTSSMPNHG